MQEVGVVVDEHRQAGEAPDDVEVAEGAAQAAEDGELRARAAMRGGDGVLDGLEVIEGDGRHSEALGEAAVQGRFLDGGAEGPGRVHDPILHAEAVPEGIFREPLALSVDQGRIGAAGHHRGRAQAPRELDDRPALRPLVLGAQEMRIDARVVDDVKDGNPIAFPMSQGGAYPLPRA